MNEDGLMDAEDLGPVEALVEGVPVPDGVVTVNGYNIPLGPHRPGLDIFIRRGSGRSVECYGGPDLESDDDIVQIIIEVAGIAAYWDSVGANVARQTSWPLGERHYIATHLTHEDGSPLSEEEIENWVLEDSDSSNGQVPIDVSRYDQMLAAVKELHDPGHTEQWYQAVAQRLNWYRDHNGDMSDCPIDVPAD